MSGSAPFSFASLRRVLSSHSVEFGLELVTLGFSFLRSGLGLLDLFLRVFVGRFKTEYLREFLQRRCLFFRLLRLHSAVAVLVLQLAVFRFVSGELLT